MDDMEREECAETGEQPPLSSDAAQVCVRDRQPNVDRLLYEKELTRTELTDLEAKIKELKSAANRSVEELVQRRLLLNDIWHQSGSRHIKGAADALDKAIRGFERLGHANEGKEEFDELTESGSEALLEIKFVLDNLDIKSDKWLHDTRQLLRTLLPGSELSLLQVELRDGLIVADRGRQARDACGSIVFNITAAVHAACQLRVRPQVPELVCELEKAREMVRVSVSRELTTWLTTRLKDNGADYRFTGELLSDLDTLVDLSDPERAVIVEHSGAIFARTSANLRDKCAVLKNIADVEGTAVQSEAHDLVTLRHSTATFEPILHSTSTPMAGAVIDPKPAQTPHSTPQAVAAPEAAVPLAAKPLESNSIQARALGFLFEMQRNGVKPKVTAVARLLCPNADETKVNNMRKNLHAMETFMSAIKSLKSAIQIPRGSITADGNIEAEEEDPGRVGQRRQTKVSE